MEYKALAEGIYNRQLIPSSHNEHDYIKHNSKKDFYVSLYKYNEAHFKKFKETKTLSGIKNVKTDRLIFDFDDSNDIDEARNDSIEIIARLISRGIDPESIAIYFSGNKGFHIELKTNHEFTRDEFKNIVFNLGADLKTFDTKVNDEQRIIRVPFTLHQKTKLFKIPLTLDQLSNSPIEIIKELANDLNSVDKDITQKWGYIDLPDEILKLKEKKYKENTSEVSIDLQNLEFDTSQINFKNCPKWLAKERYALQEGFFIDGERNTAFMILAATYKNQGFAREVAYRMLKGVAELQAARTGMDKYDNDSLWNQVIIPIYSENWNGGIYGKDEPLLLKTRARFELKEEVDEQSTIISNSGMFDSFSLYAENIKDNTIKTGLPIDDVPGLRLTIGMPVAILGAPSAGKTSCLLNILRSTSKQGLESMFFSMDMHRALVCQKQIQMMYNHNDETIFENILLSGWRKKYLESLDENFGNVHYCTKAGLTVEQIREHIIRKKENHDIKLVMIDYLECIRGPFSDPTTNTAVIADGIKNIATELDVCVILLVQPPKITGGAAYPLTNMYQIKGSSMVAQAMATVIGIYREGFSPETFDDDNFITFVGLKNRMGPLFKKDCHWDGRKGIIRDLNPLEEKELERLRERLSADRGKNDL